MDGDLDFSNPDVFGNPNVCDDIPSMCSDDSFMKFFDDTQHHACTHTHTCNPPGPDLSHSHTCYHVHTKIVSASTDETAESEEKSSKKRPCGNREAVRKYREKKKAHAASLEDEVVQLRAINQQLMKKLQNQAALESEVARLRCLLVDLRGRIEGEIGTFPYYKPKGGADLISNVNQGSMLGGGQVLNSCGFRCDDQAYCLQGKNIGQNGSFANQVFGACEVGDMQCIGNPTSGSKDIFRCGSVIGMPIDCSSNTQKIEGPELSGHMQLMGSDAPNQG